MFTMVYTTVATGTTPTIKNHTFLFLYVTKFKYHCICNDKNILVKYFPIATIRSEFSHPM